MIALLHFAESFFTFNHSFFTVVRCRTKKKGKVVAQLRYNSEKVIFSQAINGAGSLEFDSRAERIGHIVAIGLLPLRRFFGSVLLRS